MKMTSRRLAWSAWVQTFCWARFPRLAGSLDRTRRDLSIVQRLLAIAAVDLRPYFSVYLIVGQIAL